MWETWVQSLGQEDPLEKEMATYSSILAWRMPWMEEPGGLHAMGSQRVRHDWATSLTWLWSPQRKFPWLLYLNKFPFIIFYLNSPSLFFISSTVTCCYFPGGSMVKNLPAMWEDVGWIPGSGRSPGGGHGTPLQYSCLENPMDRGAWRGTVHGVAKSQTWLNNPHLFTFFWHLHGYIGASLSNF